MAASAALQLSESSVPGQLTLRPIHGAATATSDSSLSDDASLFGQLWSLGEPATRWDYGFTQGIRHAQPGSAHSADVFFRIFLTG